MSHWRIQQQRIDCDATAAVKWGRQRWGGRRHTASSWSSDCRCRATTVMTTTMMLMIVLVQWSVKATKSIVRSGSAAELIHPTSSASWSDRPLQRDPSLDRHLTAAVPLQSASYVWCATKRLNTEIGKLTLSRKPVKWLSPDAQNNAFNKRFMHCLHVDVHGVSKKLKVFVFMRDSWKNK